MTTLETIARAAYPEWFGKSGKALSIYPGQDKNYQALAFKKARLFLEAMREPSEGTVEAGMIFARGDYAPEYCDNAKKCWQAMINAILEEHDNG